MVLDQFPDNTDRLSVRPVLLRRRVEPDKTAPGVSKAIHPDTPRLLVQIFYAATGAQYFIGRHGSVPDDDHLVVAGIGVKQIPGLGHLLPAPSVILPDKIVEKIMKVEILDVLEL